MPCWPPSIPPIRMMIPVNRPIRKTVFTKLLTKVPRLILRPERTSDFTLTKSPDAFRMPSHLVKVPRHLGPVQRLKRHPPAYPDLAAGPPTIGVRRSKYNHSARACRSRQMRYTRIVADKALAQPRQSSQTAQRRMLELHEIG